MKFRSIRFRSNEFAQLGTNQLFRHLSSNIDSGHQELLFHTEVRWLSKGNVLNRFLELKVEIGEILRNVESFILLMNYGVSGIVTFVTSYKNLISSICLFLLQGKQANIMEFVDNLTASNK